MQHPPLLLTWTVKPQTSYELNLTDPNKRYRQYILTLIKYITESEFDTFVFCENSNAELPHIQLVTDLCDLMWKRIEILQFTGDAEKIKELTRAFGDQEIMEYAVTNSSYIKEAWAFYKTTWRYRVKNINEVLNAWAQEKTVFVKWWLGKKTVHTAFFKTTIPFFNEHFMWKSPQLTRFENCSLERLYYRNVVQSGIPMRLHGVHPRFSGERWAGGILDESFIMSLKTTLFAKLGVYNIN